MCLYVRLYDSVRQFFNMYELLLIRPNSIKKLFIVNTFTFEALQLIPQPPKVYSAALTETAAVELCIKLDLNLLNCLEEIIFQLNFIKKFNIPNRNE